MIPISFKAYSSINSGVWVSGGPFDILRSLQSICWPKDQATNWARSRSRPGQLQARAQISESLPQGKYYTIYYVLYTIYCILYTIYYRLSISSLLYTQSKQRIPLLWTQSGPQYIPTVYHIGQNATGAHIARPYGKKPFNEWDRINPRKVLHIGSLDTLTKDSCPLGFPGSGPMNVTQRSWETYSELHRGHPEF